MSKTIRRTTPVLPFIFLFVPLDLENKEDNVDVFKRREGNYINFLILFKFASEPWKLKILITFSSGLFETDDFHPAQNATPFFESSSYKFQPNKGFYPNLSQRKRKKLFRSSLTQRHINYNYNM